MFATTIVAPTGVEHIIDKSMPTNAQITEITADTITTPRKLYIKRIAESVGKIINADINKDPTNFIPKTIITAIIMAVSM